MTHLLLLAVMTVVAGPMPGEDTRLHTDRSAVPLVVPEEDDAFTFVVFGDRTGGPDSGIAVLEQAVQDANTLDPDFVITVGDMIQGYNARPAWLAEMSQFKGVMRGLDMPWFPVAGNHDIYWRGAGRPSEEHEGDYEQWFGPLWYAFDHKDCRFIVLYTDEGDPQTTRRTFSEPNCQRMSPEQFEWLQGILAGGKDKRHQFVFMHHPRWRGGGYGDDWTRIHEQLVKAGNVSSVFAGHVHRLVHDGPIDGIEYISLATVGGHLPRHLPEGGWLDHTLQVMVRDEGISMAALPVGGVIDPSTYTPEHVTRIERLAALTPTVDLHQDTVSGDAVAEGRLTWSNPLSIPVQLDVVLHSADNRWTIRPDHVHLDLPASGQVDLPVQFHHPGLLDVHWAAIDVEVTAGFTADGRGWRVQTPGAEVQVIGTMMPDTEWSPALLDVPGSGGLRVQSEARIAADAPFTLECWINPRDLDGRRGAVTKTENAEYGIFVTDAKPYFCVHLDGAYVHAHAKDTLAMGQWHHLAGVYDGEAVHLYVNGERVKTTPGSGTRTINTLPLMVGGDVNAAGDLVSAIDGQIDLVRLSHGVRYHGDAFTPQRRFTYDDTTRLLLDMDSAIGPWVPSRSYPGGAGRILAPAKITSDDVSVQ